MQFLGLDKNFNLVVYLVPTNVQWIDRYYNFNEFKMDVPLKFYDKSIRYIYRNDREQLMICQRVEFSNNSNKKSVQLSGYGIEYLLNNSLVYPRYKKTMNIELMARDLFETYADEYLKSMISLGEIYNIGKSLSMQESNENLGNKLFHLLETQELSYKIRYDNKTNDLLLEVWQGLDRTQEKQENSTVIFSTKFRNILNIQYTKDDSAYKNYAVVVGNGDYESGKQVIVEVDRIKDGEEKRMLYVNAAAETWDSEYTEQTLDQFKESLRHKGEEALDKNSLVFDSTFNVVDSTFRYGVDYNLGDKCDIIIDDIEESFSARVTEVYQVFKEQSVTTTLTFGERTPTLYEKARLG